MTRRDVNDLSSTGSNSSSSTIISEVVNSVSEDLPTPSRRGRSRRTKRSINSSGKRRANTNDEPFIVTFFKVGGTLLVVWVFSYALFVQRQLWSPATKDDAFRQQQMAGDRVSTGGRRRPPKKATTHPPLPMPIIGAFDEEKAQTDAFGIANLTNASHLDPTLKAFFEQSALLRSQFAEMVHGEEEARAVLQRSLRSVRPSGHEAADVTSPRSLALRLRRILLNDTPKTFSITIVGSSAAASAGINQLQSYASVMKKTLTPLFESLGFDLVVRNLAIDETAEFPSIWCLLSDDNGTNTDVLVWDYGPTSSPESFEAFLRNMVARSATASRGRFPLLIVRDSKTPVYNDLRDRLLQYYVDQNAVVDPLLVHADRAAAPYLRLQKEDTPEVFKEWGRIREEKDSQLPLQQHNMTGWLISMFILSGLELMARDEADSSDLPLTLRQHSNHSALLPPPLTIRKSTPESWVTEKGDGLVLQSSPAWLPIVVGEPAENALEKFTSGEEEEDDEQKPYKFPSRGLKCRTSYISTQAPETLKGIILSGVASNAIDANKDGTPSLQALLLPKGSVFSSGWVPDLDRNTKRKMQLSQWGPSDAIKKAYYGYPRSGDLRLFLPLSNDLHERAETELNAKGFMPARDFIETVTICEADVSDYDDTEATCRLYRDAYVYLGGAMAFLEPLPLSVSLSCVTMNVPDEANLAYRHEAEEEANQGHETPFESNSETMLIGLLVVVRVTSVGGSFKDPCSVAHVLWN
jgi:hypothetical protein